MQSRISPRSNSCSTVQTGIELTSLEQRRPSCACQQNGRDAVLNPEIAILQTVIGFTEQSPVHSECRPALKVWCASPEATLASLQVSRAREKVSRATLRVRLATLWGSREGDGAAMKPDFGGFMAVEQSRIMLCGCRERVLERTAPVREALPAWRPSWPEACGRNACPSPRLQSGGWAPAQGVLVTAYTVRAAA